MSLRLRRCTAARLLGGLAIVVASAGGGATAWAASRATSGAVERVFAGAAAGPYSLAVEAGVGVGVLFATHGKVGVGLGRQLWDRIEVEAALRFDIGERFLGLEGLAGLAVLFDVAPRWRVLLRGQLGYAQFRQSLPRQNLWTGALVTGLAAEVRYLITARFELRLRPVAVAGYLNGIWGLTFEPSAGVGYRF